MTAPDPRPLLARAMDQAADLVSGTRVEELGLPTPCEGWDVRTLCSHIVGVHHRIAHIARGALPSDISSMPEVADGRHTAELAAARADVDRAWGLDGGDDGDVLDREVVVPWGTMPARFAGFGYVQELTVHAWDLAAATDRVEGLDEGLAVAVEETAHRVLPAEPRGGPIPFGPPVPAGDDARPYARLVAWLGRNPTFSTNGMAAGR